MWKRYVYDTLEVVKRGLTEFLNNLDDSGCIKFTYEVETEGQLPFLDLLLKRTNSGMLKLSVYRKPTHTDQYLNFMSHHPIDHKMSVVRTLLERNQNLVSQREDKKKEDIHVQDALRTCGYPEWSFQKARRQMKQMKPKKKRKQNVAASRPLVVIPYVENVSETVARIMKKYNVPCAMKPYSQECLGTPQRS